VKSCVVLSCAFTAFAVLLGLFTVGTDRLSSPGDKQPDFAINVVTTTTITGTKLTTAYGSVAPTTMLTTSVATRGYVIQGTAQVSFGTSALAEAFVTHANATQQIENLLATLVGQMSDVYVRMSIKAARRLFMAVDRSRSALLRGRALQEAGVILVEVSYFIDVPVLGSDVAVQSVRDELEVALPGRLESVVTAYNGSVEGTAVPVVMKLEHFASGIPDDAGPGPESDLPTLFWNPWLVLTLAITVSAVATVIGSYVLKGLETKAFALCRDKSASDFFKVEGLDTFQDDASFLLTWAEGDLFFANDEHKVMFTSLALLAAFSTIMFVVELGLWWRGKRSGCWDALDTRNYLFCFRLLVAVHYIFEDVLQLLLYSMIACSQSDTLFQGIALPAALFQSAVFLLARVYDLVQLVRQTREDAERMEEARDQIEEAHGNAADAKAKRAEAEEKAQEAETYRAQAETQRAQAEAKAQEAETQRALAEAKAQEAEAKRAEATQDAETQRARAEAKAQEAETQRALAEAKAQEAEAKRAEATQDAETQRARAEAKAQEAETQRALAEAKAHNAERALAEAFAQLAQARAHQPETEHPQAETKKAEIAGSMDPLSDLAGAPSAESRGRRKQPELTGAATPPKLTDVRLGPGPCPAAAAPHSLIEMAVMTSRASAQPGPQSESA